MGRGWNVAVGLVSDTTWVTPQAWRIVSRCSSTHGAPIGSGFSALIFFGSFLYQDKKEHVNHSLPCFSVAMQRFSVALWKNYCVHRYSSGLAFWLQTLRPYGAVQGIHEGDSSTSSEWQHHWLPHSLYHVERKQNISWGRLEILRCTLDDRYVYFIN